MDLGLSASTALLVSRVRGSITVCLDSAAMVESTAGSCCPATFLFSGYAPAVSGLPTVGLSAVVDPATYIYPCRLSFQPSLRLFFRLLSTVTFSTTCGSILGQRRRNRGGNGCAEGARSPLQSAGRKYLRPRNNMPSLSAG